MEIVRLSGNTHWRKWMFFRKILLVLLAILAICLVVPTVAIAAPCDQVSGEWQVTLNSGMSYSASISAGGTLQSHCSGCSEQTWTCAGNTFTVHGPGSVSIAHTLSADGAHMTSSVSSLVKLVGNPTPKKQVGNCSPSARMETRNQGGTEYEILIANNNCPSSISFGFQIETRALGTTKSYWTRCVPPNRTNYDTGIRTSSTEMATLSYLGQYRQCN